MNEVGFYRQHVFFSRPKINFLPVSFINKKKKESESKKEKTLYVSDFIKKNGFSIAGKMVMEKDNGDKTVMEVMSFKPDIIISCLAVEPIKLLWRLS